MDLKKEILLIVATTLVSAGAVILPKNTWEGVAVLLIGALVFVARGFYKKYVS